MKSRSAPHRAALAYFDVALCSYASAPRGDQLSLLKTVRGYRFQLSVRNYTRGRRVSRHRKIDGRMERGARRRPYSAAATSSGHSVCREEIECGAGVRSRSGFRREQCHPMNFTPSSPVFQRFHVASYSPALRQSLKELFQVGVLFFGSEMRLKE
jgi:hypothetical protein